MLEMLMLFSILQALIAIEGFLNVSLLEAILILAHIADLISSTFADR
jgi:hypothetical protein